MNQIDYYDVTEISGDVVSAEQVERMIQRYEWAASFCDKKDVIEIGCGTGQGLGLLSRSSKSIVATDYSAKLLNIASSHYKDRIEFVEMDAHKILYEDNSFDTVILFEAIYYLRDPRLFISEAKRVLRDKGILLLAMANKSLFDFNPSPHTYHYFSVTELQAELLNAGFVTNFFAGFPVAKISFRQKLFRPIKKLAVSLNLVPKSMAGKKLLKKIVFGKMLKMPAEIRNDSQRIIKPTKIPHHIDNRKHKVIYCAAQIQK